MLSGSTRDETGGHKEGLIRYAWWAFRFMQIAVMWRAQGSESLRLLIDGAYRHDVPAR
jgi:hypothetical protein